MDDFQNFVEKTVTGLNDTYRAGMEAERITAAFRDILSGKTTPEITGMSLMAQLSPTRGDVMIDSLRLIIREYDRCKDSENVKIPTRLELAIEAARKGVTL